MKTSDQDCPELRTDVDLSNVPLKYLKKRIRAVKNREYDNLYKLKTAGPNDYLYMSQDLGMP